MKAAKLECDARDAAIRTALDAVEQHVTDAANGLDIDYFRHRLRYNRNIRRIYKLFPRAGKFSMSVVIISTLPPP